MYCQAGQSSRAGWVFQSPVFDSQSDVARNWLTLSTSVPKPLFISDGQIVSEFSDDYWNENGTVEHSGTNRGQRHWLVG